MTLILLRLRSSGFKELEIVVLRHVAPEWTLGVFLGVGGFAGACCGARLQSHLPERSLRRLLGCVACLVAARYLETAATERPARQPVLHRAFA
jgi:uncharacterized protein